MSQPERRPAAWTYRPELDGIRTFAVIIIIFYHAGASRAGNAFIALDLFFVLSGFLVTNVIMSEIDTKGTLRLGGYYARRVRRLLPAAVLVILITCVVFVLVATLPERTTFIRQAQAALVYLANWQFIAESHDYFARDVDRSPFMHFWSLSIEEQYYIFFPLIIVGVLAFARRRAEDSWVRQHWSRVLMLVLLGITALSLISQIISAAHDPIRAYFATDARLYQLMIGGVVAIALREFAGRWRTRSGHVAWPRAGFWLASAALVGFVVFGSPWLEMSVSVRGMIATVLSLALVVGLYTAPGSLPGWLFSRPTPVFLGKISYGTYLFHWPMILVVDQLFEIRPAAVAVIAGTMATAMAALSYQLYETPIRKAKPLDGVPWPTVVTGLTVSVLAAAFAVGPILNSGRSPVVPMAVDAAGSTGVPGVAVEIDEKLQRPVPPDLDFVAIAEDKGGPNKWCTPENVEDCLVVDNDGPHVVLVGDSQARLLRPALAKLAQEHGFKLSVNVVAGCGWQVGVWNTSAGPKNFRECHEARENFFSDALPAMGADVVIPVSFARSDPSWEGRLVDDQDNARPVAELLLQGTRETLDQISAAGARTVLMKSMMGTDGFGKGWDPLDCLARASTLGDCVVTPVIDSPLVDGFYDTFAQAREDVTTVDINPVICPDAPTCLPVIDGRVVWREDNHLTSVIVRYLRAGLWERLVETGFLETESG